jgi:hypothetical protein
MMIVAGQPRSNARVAIALATVALAFFLGIIAKYLFFK